MNYALITVDTEGHDGKDPIDKLIWGRIGSDKFAGIDLIMDIAESHHTKALFFLDFAEAWDYGKDRIVEVSRHIDARGHDVGVHIHPDHMSDKNRLFLWEYSKEEQKEIISKCTELYKEALGKMPKAFRAGKYSANYDTLDIINDLGYSYDFSSFLGQKWCGINPVFTADMPCKYKDLIEFPVTAFKSADTPLLVRYDKLDMEMVFSQFQYVVNKISKGNNNVISLFLHSFSLIKWRKDPDNPVLWDKNVKKYKDCLNEIEENNNIILVSLNELEDLIESKILPISKIGNDEPQIKVKNWVLAYYFLLTTSIRIAEHNKKARIFIIFNIILILVLILANLIL